MTVQPWFQVERKSKSLTPATAKMKSAGILDMYEYVYQLTRK